MIDSDDELIDLVTSEVDEDKIGSLAALSCTNEEEEMGSSLATDSEALEKEEREGEDEMIDDDTQTELSSSPTTVFIVLVSNEESSVSISLVK